MSDLSQKSSAETNGRGVLVCILYCIMYLHVRALFGNLLRSREKKRTINSASFLGKIVRLYIYDDNCSMRKTISCRP